MALRSIRVIELAGLAPVPMAGMLLADFGASVVRIDKANSSQPDVDRLMRGKRSISVDLKQPRGIAVVRLLCRTADVLIEPYRPGVMEKLGLGPKTLMSDNPRLIYARLTGFGQSGPFSKMAGHDINYLALSGALSRFGRADENPLPPVNMLADFAGGGLLCAFGILVALLQRQSSDCGQVIDHSMVEGAAYVCSWLFKSQDLDLVWGKPRGYNLLDSGFPLYDTYRTKDGRFMAVGALEPQFQVAFIEKLDPTLELSAVLANPAEGRRILADRFSKRTQREWCAIFDYTDSCCTPVLELDEVGLHPHHLQRDAFRRTDRKECPFEPKPAPKLDNSKQHNLDCADCQKGQHSVQILTELGYDKALIDDLLRDGVIEQLRLPAAKI